MSSEPLGGVKDLEVTDPTTSSLRVRWDPAEGNVRQYRIFYSAEAGGAEDVVRLRTLEQDRQDPCRQLQMF